VLRRTILKVLPLAAAGLPLATGLAQAQDQAAGYPDKVVTIVVPFPAGGSSDTMGRLVAQELSKSLGQQFIVDNKPGANGNIGAAQVARAEPDGYTLLLSGVGSNAINYTLYPKLGYDPQDLAHVTLFDTGPNVLVANPEFEAKTFKEFIELAKTHPGEYNYASSGNGSSGHLAMEMLKQAAGIDLQHVPYKGGAPAMTDVMGGQVPVLFINQDAVLPHVKAGKMVALAVASLERNPAYPDTPTIAESGYPGFAAQSWFGLSAPAGTPKPIINKLHDASVKALQGSELKQRLESNGFVVVGSTPEEYAAWIEAETKKWAKVIEASGAKIE
jgi:tripartite-type tricarboxylate transporter receptor subunit TctC